MREVTLRGKVTAYPEEDKGLVEVAVAAYSQDADKVLARVEHSLGGAYWLPEVDDAVEVALPSQPGASARIVRVLRREGDEQAAACWTAQNDKKQLRTRSGHTLTLDDTQDAAAITVSTAGGLTLRLDDAAGTITLGKTDADTSLLTLDTDKDEVCLSAGKALRLRCGGAELSIDGDGNLRLSTGGDLSVSAGSITLEGSGDLTAKGRQVELSGSMKTAVSGQSGLELTSGGVTQVKGSMVKLN